MANCHSGTKAQTTGSFLSQAEKALLQDAIEELFGPAEELLEMLADFRLSSKSLPKWMQKIIAEPEYEAKIRQLREQNEERGEVISRERKDLLKLTGLKALEVKHLLGCRMQSGDMFVLNIDLNRSSSRYTYSRRPVVLIAEPFLNESQDSIKPVPGFWWAWFAINYNRVDESLFGQYDQALSTTHPEEDYVVQSWNRVLVHESDVYMHKEGAVSKKDLGRINQLWSQYISSHLETKEETCAQQFFQTICLNLGATISSKARRRLQKR